MTYLKMEMSVKDDDEDDNDNALLVHISQSIFRKKATGIRFS